MRAMSRRTTLTRPVASSWPVARWKRRLNCSFRKSRSWVCSSSAVLARMSTIFVMASGLRAQALHDLGPDRQLGGAERQRLLGGVERHAVNLEHDPARLDPRHPVFGRALAGAHADLGRLGGHGHIREDPDPHAALALHGAGDRAAGRLDLPGGHPLRLQRLQAEAAEGQREAALGDALDPALMGLAEGRALELQHLTYPLALRRLLGGALVLRHRVMRQDLALEDPDLHAAGAVGGLRRRRAEIDIRAQRVQRHPPLAVPLHARDLGAAEPPGAVDADAARAEAHRALHRALHGAAES